MAISRFRVGKDGKTAYERQRGKRCYGGVVPFGERVWFRQLDHEDGKKRSLQTKWQEGVWLGHCRESNETWVGRGGVAVRAWSIRRRINSERWDRNMVLQLKATPQDTTKTKIESHEDQQA